MHEILLGMQEEKTAGCAEADDVEIDSKIEGEEMNDLKIILQCFGTPGGRIWSVSWHDCTGRMIEQTFEKYEAAKSLADKLRKGVYQNV